MACAAKTEPVLLQNFTSRPQAKSGVDCALAKNPSWLSQDSPSEMRYLTRTKIGSGCSVISSLGCSVGIITMRTPIIDVHTRLR